MGLTLILETLLGPSARAMSERNNKEGKIRKNFHLIPPYTTFPFLGLKVYA